MGESKLKAVRASRDSKAAAAKSEYRGKDLLRITSVSIVAAGNSACQLRTVKLVAAYRTWACGDAAGGKFPAGGCKELLLEKQRVSKPSLRDAR